MLPNNHFHAEFQEFRETSFFQYLEKKFTPLPYYKKYRSVKMLTLIPPACSTL